MVMKKVKKLWILSIPLVIGLLFIPGLPRDTEVWVGEAVTTEEKLAKEACICMYQTLKEKGYDSDRMVGKTIEEIKQDHALNQQWQEIEALNFYQIPCFNSFFKNKMAAVARGLFDQERSRQAYKKSRLPIYR